MKRQKRVENGTKRGRGQQRNNLKDYGKNITSRFLHGFVKILSGLFLWESLATLEEGVRRKTV